MSKINDALKRAKDSQRKDTPNIVSPMLPMETKAPARGQNWLLPAAIFFLIIVAIFIFALSAVVRLTKQKVAGPAVVPAQAAGVAVAPAPMTNSLPAVTNPVAVAAVIPPVVPAKVPKPLRVQGIVADPLHPWAIINNKTVYVGDVVDGMRVAAIARDSVTLVGKGETKKLAVGQ